MKMKKKKLLTGIGIFLGFVIAGIVLFSVVYHVGKKNIKTNILNSLTDIVDVSAYETVSYQGEEYIYRDNIINILCLGLDKEEVMGMRNDADASMGQADAIFLLSIDLEEDKIRLIAVPRDTMVTLQMHRTDGTYIGEREGQITLQYAYGDGKELSAMLMAQQVSSILDNIPIHAYMVVNVHSLWMLNDAIGGVDMVMDADYTKFNPAFVEGETVHLTGNLLENYIRGRDKKDPEGAYTRMHRMKLYMMGFFEQAKKAVLKDITLPVEMLSVLEKDIVTNVTADEVVYLVAEGMWCSFRSEDMYNLPGDNRLVDRYMEYRLDEEGVQRIVLDLFYEKK